MIMSDLGYLSSFSRKWEKTSVNIGYACSGVAAGALTVGDVVMIGAYFAAIQRPLGFLGSTYRDLTQAKERVFALIRS